jgi:hypothetical protein
MSNEFYNTGDSYVDHNYSINHLINVSIEVFAKEKILYHINLDSASIIERKYSYLEWDRNYNYLKDEASKTEAKKQG